MTICELIALLTKENQDLTVLINDSEYGQFIADDIEIDETTMLLIGSVEYKYPAEIAKEHAKQAHAITHEMHIVEDPNHGPPFMRHVCRLCGRSGAQILTEDCTG
jgi:hypothetical protein